MAFKEPSKRTLDKYGLSTPDFWAMDGIQNHACKICERSFETVRCFIDHRHVKGFKAMPPSEKRKHVTGLLCFTCNRYRVAKNTVATAVRVLAYLQGVL